MLIAQPRKKYTGRHKSERSKKSCLRNKALFFLSAEGCKNISKIRKYHCHVCDFYLFVLIV